ncbi:PTS glucose transporter subunit IIA [Haloechinothrix salitolerans]|uniref:PTS glucose transporter subunit IIA n=1 Tax=Haloechinothrix salitolerans TaxID=926830 RepID=A0ABW2C176_9PSEU
MSIAVAAPLPGTVVPLADVPDAVFSAALVGPGAAIDPLRGPVVATAPVAGRIVKLHPHAFVVATDDGAGVLVHLGIDTVQLDGEGFTVHITEGVTVEAGAPIVSFDAADVEAGGRSPMCPVVALDADGAALTDLRTDGAVAAGDVLFGWTY